MAGESGARIYDEVNASSPRGRGWRRGPIRCRFADWSPGSLHATDTRRVRARLRASRLRRAAPSSAYAHAMPVLIQPHTAALWAIAAEMVDEYAASLEFALDFQNFAHERAPLFLQDEQLKPERLIRCLSDICQLPCT